MVSRYGHSQEEIKEMGDEYGKVSDLIKEGKWVRCTSVLLPTE